MSMSTKLRNGAMTIGAFGALALGGSALANAASNNNSTAATGSNSSGGHVGANGKAEVALSGDVAAKVEAAAKAKVPGGTILRVETDVDHGSPYEAHVQKSDGTRVEVLVDSSFAVTAVR
jgi:uncharacterized membrane protein YkoI